MKQIPLSRGLFAIVDDEDYEMVVARGKWYAHIGNPKNPSFYARRQEPIGNGKRVSVWIHSLVMNGLANVDHINGDSLDNRRANLRAATHAGQSANRGRWITNTSGYKGVSWRKDNGKWRARIGVNGCYQLGNFDSAIEAARAYDAAAIELFGEFARLNFPKAAWQ